MYLVASGSSRKGRPATLVLMAPAKEPDVERYVDPVVEYYKQFVDRAALRENLQLTIEERLEKLQRWADDRARHAELRQSDRPQASAVREEPAAYVSDPTVDLVVEAYKKDVDRTLLRENLKLTPGQRVEKLQRFMHDFAAIRGAARRSR